MSILPVVHRDSDVLIDQIIDIPRCFPMQVGVWACIHPILFDLNMYSVLSEESHSVIYRVSRGSGSLKRGRSIGPVVHPARSHPVIPISCSCSFSYHHKTVNIKLIATLSGSLWLLIIVAKIPGDNNSCNDCQDDS